MTDDRRKVIDAFLNNEEESRVPVAFWHHFVSFHDHYSGADEEIYQTVLREQKKFADEVKPDLLKIMSDGFFGHPSVCRKTIRTTEDLAELGSVGAAKCIASDTKCLVKRLFEETSVDGIYYSVQCVQDKLMTHEGHRKLVEPLDLDVLQYINRFSDRTILHICGYGKYTNHLSWYKEYPVKAYNWAVYSEGIGLAEGKKLLNEKPVLGGFDNAEGSILYTGSEEELREEIRRILDEAGTKGVAIGADCTISSEVTAERLELIRRLVSEYHKS